MPKDNSTQERISQKLSPAAATKSKRGVIIAICCTVVVVIAVVAAAIIFLKQSDDVDKRNVIVTPDNVDEVLADLQDKPEATGSYEVMMNTTWEFEKGDSASTNAYVENSTSNTNDVYFDIVRSDTGDTIFSSPTIPVGSHLENITLDKSLSKGSHACVLTYHLLDSKGKPVSKVNVNLTINVAK